MKKFLPALLCALLVLPMGCDQDPFGLLEDTKDTRYYGNVFAFNMMNTYYLWREEVSAEFDSWTYKEDPIAKVDSMRYRGADGKPIDKWTRLMEDCSSFLGAVTGNTKSLGFDFGLYYLDEAQYKVYALVLYTFADSPAARAGLKRGDVILTLDGQEINTDNYQTLVSEKLYGGGKVTLGLSGGQSVALQAVQMYENPVQTVRTLDVEGKKVGYLHFTGFTLDACRDLEETFRQFCADGIEELVLDLRYNGGGYTQTGAVLASMLAPLEEVNSGSIFTREVYNKTLAESEAFKDQLTTPFAPEFELSASADGSSYKVYPSQVNPGVRKLWVITTDNTASASEALICGLKPYMDVTLVGEQTYGKFCGGYLIQAEDFYELLSRQEDTDIDTDEGASKLAGWGIYVIASRYSDCNGVTLSMPSGIPADYAVKDNPRDGFQLGDPSETMLAQVLALSSGQQTKAPAAGPALHPAPPVRRAGFGTLLYPGPACGN